ncbi:hypothetical protein [Streptomyces triticirhizae]|uniref:hypothetical protein n=1 Tax=Streptomyces triticirhizae TaxID=2483353 RepID=UPI0013150D5E|nr:hypothetical protein [Streptomyces triticirhizae]
MGSLLGLRQPARSRQVHAAFNALVASALPRGGVALLVAPGSWASFVNAAGQNGLRPA